MNTHGLVFDKLVSVACSQLSEGRNVVVPALVEFIMDCRLCADRSLAKILAVAVWNEASKKEA